MLATGGSSAAAVQMLKDRGVKSIRFLCIIAAPEGVEKMRNAHPDVDLYIGAMDERLNEHGYIRAGAWATPATGSSEQNKKRKGILLSRRSVWPERGFLFLYLRIFLFTDRIRSNILNSR